MVLWFVSVSVGTILSWVGEEEDEETYPSMQNFYSVTIFSTIAHLIPRVLTTLYYLEKNKKLEAFCNFKCTFQFIS
jgi:Na+-driven multidrug efflux pump